MPSENDLKSPLVSIGIPTYNRPEGLKRTLSNIINQTYHNIEIIVSDNASPDPIVGHIVEYFLSIDDRIIYFKQEKNIGAEHNFKFVLKQASGEYFMWAADDDEWHPNFIAKCLSVIGQANSSMSAFNINFRKRKTIIPQTVPVLNMSLNKFTNCYNYLENCRSSLYYGIHKTESIQFFLMDAIWDYYDCFFVLKQILSGGFVTIPEILYTAGIDTLEYSFKPFYPKKNKIFQYRPFFIASSKEILKCKQISVNEKIKLLRKLTKTIINLFVQYEAQVRPMKTKLLSYISKFI